MPVRKLLPGQGCQIWTVDPTGTDQVRWFETASYRLESPNWLSSGDALLLNGEGRLWRLPLSAGAGLKPVEISQVPQLNNDHVLDPDGKHIYLSTYDRQLYRAPIHGGAADRVSDPSSSPEGLQHYLHGVHPRGDRLAVVGLITTEDGDRPAANIYTMSAGGGDYRQLTFGPGHSDGAEYSPDGDWVYFNTECFDGQAQIARVRPDGSDLQQLTFDNCVNWFPHLSPDGRWAAYLAYPPGTQGHPPDVWVDLKVVALPDWSAAATVLRVFGGQGTLNTPCWAPDSTAFAYVTYSELAP